MRPLPYKFSNNAIILGHYKVAQRSGAIAATPTALDHWARIRYVPTKNSNAKLVLCRLLAGLSVSGAVTTTVQTILDAIIARAYTVDHDAAITNISMAGNTGKMDVSMGSSLLDTKGPGICTTAPMTGQTLTLDGAAFAIAPVPLLQAVTATGTAVALPVGAASPMVKLYDWTDLGGHPPTLTVNEGILVRTVLAGHATGTMVLHTVWEWAEVIDPF